jgi:hypothetical protein
MLDAYELEPKLGAMAVDFAVTLADMLHPSLGAFCLPENQPVARHREVDTSNTGVVRHSVHRSQLSSAASVTDDLRRGVLFLLRLRLLGVSHPGLGWDTIVRLPGILRQLDFRGYAAARAQACWTSRISSVVAGRGDVGRNRAAMIWRRRLVSMSRVAGSVFDPYHGADARRCATSAVGWPWRWYQRMSRL